MSIKLAQRHPAPVFNPEDFVSPVIKAIPPSGIRKFFDLASSSKGVISLGVGEPDFVTPWHIREAGVYSLEKGYTMYTSNWGMPELRREISRHTKEQSGIEYSPDNEVLVTVGASEAVDLALRAITSTGDEVLVPEPSYISYKPCVLMAGGQPVTVKTSMSSSFKLLPEQLEKAITPRSKALVLCYPNNPTGAVMNREELLAVAKVVEKHNLLVISDEIYGELTYGGEHQSFSGLPGMRERTILVNGFSKAYAMTGWRIGYAMGNPVLIGAMTKIHQYTMLCAPVMAQMAAVEALRRGAAGKQSMVEQYNQRRRLVLGRLQEIGLQCFEPKGAFYVFPSVATTGLTSEEFAEKLIYEEQVAVVPGSVFGASGEGHVRISYASSIAQLNEALHRIERFVSHHRQGEE